MSGQVVTISLTVNGEEVSQAVEARTSLADLLRDHLGLAGTRLGCEHGVCGACNVLIDGVAARSCIQLAVACANRQVTTVEGLEGDPIADQLRVEFRKHHGLQCGFCTAGMIVSATDVLRRVDDLSEDACRAELAGNLCRCTGYGGIVRAVMAAAEAKGDGPAPERG